MLKPCTCPSCAARPASAAQILAEYFVAALCVVIVLRVAAHALAPTFHQLAGALS